MYFDPACIPCILTQAYRAAQLFGKGDKEFQLHLLKKVSEEIKCIDDNYTAPHFSLMIQEVIEDSIGSSNPYKDIKDKNLALVKKYLPIIDSFVETTENKFETAIKIAIIGNAIDIGANPNFDLPAELKNLTDELLPLKNIDSLINDLNAAESILYIGDNYEEALFDKYLLREISEKKLTFAVRSKPILNDITLEDAKYLGIDKICDVMESGSKIAGVDLKNCSSEFVDLFYNADVVIAKGQGNFETLIDNDREIYFLFKVKCESIAKRSKTVKGSSVIYNNFFLKN